MVIVIVLIIALAAYFIYWAKRLKNPYNLTFIFGKKGSGKSTLLQKELNRHKKEGWICFSNDRGLTCDNYFDFEEFGKKTFPPRSFVVIDEIGSLAHARDFKTFRKDQRDIFRYIRKQQLRILCCSQTFDVDKTIRDQVDTMYLAVKVGPFSVAKKITKKFVLTLATSDSPSQISENLRFTMFTEWKYTFIPSYIKDFDTAYTREEYEYFPYTVTPYKPPCKKSLRSIGKSLALAFAKIRMSIEKRIMKVK